MVHQEKLGPQFHLQILKFQKFTLKFNNNITKTSTELQTLWKNYKNIQYFTLIKKLNVCEQWNYEALEAWAQRPGCKCSTKCYNPAVLLQ